MKSAVYSLTAFGILVSLGLATQAHSMSAQALHEACQAEDRSVCMSYVGGFVDGAVTTDPRVVENLLIESTELTPLMQRAIRTRTTERMQRLGQSAYASFCIDKNQTTRSIVAAVMASGAPGPEDKSAREWLYQSLKRAFPCAN